MSSRTVRGYITSSNISASTELPLFDTLGASTAVAANEQFILDSIHVYSEITSGRVDLFADTDDDNTNDAGEALCTIGTTASLQRSHGQVFPNGLYGAVGAKPHVIASTTGITAVSVSGRIRRVS